MKKCFNIVSILFLLLIGIIGYAADPENIRLATTTSTDNSGLLKYLLPLFEKKYQVKVQVIAVGTGKALKLGENGDVDVVLVHSRPDEDKFIDQGYGINRRDVMYNDFVVVGTKEDPAGVRGMTDVIAAFKKIESAHIRFVSRADDSGTDKMEKSYWKLAAVMPKDSFYVSAGQGMAEVLMMTSQFRGYTLSDRATYAATIAQTGLEVLVEGDKRLFNPYGVIAVNPKKYPGINYSGAMKFVEWITSSEGQAEIANFKINGKQLFYGMSNNK